MTTALLCGAGYIIAISSVLAISGGFLSMVLNYYLGWNVPWIIFSVLLTGGAVVMTIRGVGVSTKLAAVLDREDPPGQMAPYDWFPYAALAIVVVAVIYGYVPNRRDRRGRRQRLTANFRLRSQAGCRFGDNGVRRI